MKEFHLRRTAVQLFAGEFVELQPAWVWG